MNLQEILSGAENGQGLEGLAKKFGIDSNTIQQIAKQVLPAFSSGLKRNTKTQQGVDDLSQALQKGNYQKFYDSPSAQSDDTHQAEGNKILHNMLGGKEVSRAVAARTEQKTGVASSLIKKMLPYLATMVIGGLSKHFQAGATGTQQASTTGGGGILGKLLGGLFGGASAGNSASTSNSGQSSTTSSLLSMLDADGDGSVADDIFDFAKKFITK